MTLFDRRRSQRPSRDGHELVGDCQAFLLGQMAERLEARDEVVPTWAWMNLLAHGSRTELRRDRDNEVPSGLPLHRPWRRARAYLAAEVLALAELSGSLEHVQSQVLRPLELDLAAARQAILWQPGQWAARVSSVLGTFREEAMHVPGREWSQERGARHDSTAT